MLAATFPVKQYTDSIRLQYQYNTENHSLYLSQLGCMHTEDKRNYVKTVCPALDVCFYAMQCFTVYLFLQCFEL